MTPISPDRDGWRDRLVDAIPLRITPFAVALLAAQSVTFAFAARETYLQSDYGWRELAAQHLDARTALMVIATYLSLLLVAQLATLASGGRRALAIILNLLLLSGYGAFWVYRAAAGTNLDYNLISENIGELFAGQVEQVLAIMRRRVSDGVWGGLAAASLMIAIAEWRWRFLSWQRRPRRLMPRLGAALGLYAALLWLPSYDELGYLLQTAYRHHVGGGLGRYAEKLERPFPYLRRLDPGQRSSLLPSDVPRPDVVLVLVESYNANFVGKLAPSGGSITPVLDGLIRKGIYVDHFYGNSIQSAKGWLASFCSILPGIRRKVLVVRPELRLRCLPQLLRSGGYRTAFYTAMQDLDFDRTGELMRRIGFSTVKAMDGSFVNDAEERHLWGWGLRDDLFYRKVLADVDRELARSRPLFLTLATVANHIPFDAVPPGERSIYPEPRDGKQRYANSIHASDRALETLLRELRRRPRLREALLVITGDHSMPVGEHGRYFNEIGHNEELYRTPALLYWPGKLRPARIADVAFSQLDIAPTIATLAGIGGQTHFLGRLIRPGAGQRAIHLIQPYDGIHLAAVLYPHKYVKHLRSGREFLYDLARDPQERRNLIGERGGSPELERLRRSLSAILLNQQLVESNRVWPLRGKAQ